MEQQIARIALSGVPYSADKLYSYLVPPELADACRAGVRVSVPFGRGNRRTEGFVLETLCEAADKPLKPVFTVLDEQPLLDTSLLRLAKWMKARYFCTVYDALKTILPAGIWFRYRETYRLADGVQESDLSALAAANRTDKLLLEAVTARGELERSELEELGGAQTMKRLKLLCEQGVLYSETTAIRQISDKSVRMVSLAVSAEDALAAVEPKRRSAPLRYAAVEMLCAQGTLSSSDICYYTGASLQTLRGLEKAGIVSFAKQEVLRVSRHEPVEMALSIVLNDEQQQAFDGLLPLIARREAGAALLHGVTASGKTQVYIRLIEETLAMGRTAMLLVPEIALTPQMIRIFSSYFGEDVAVLHSSLAVGERYDEWKRIKTGRARVVIGTRSAVFAPCSDLGLIIMDEEQEYTYKSENSPRYHARDAAKFRCASSNALLVLGSATPDVESRYRAEMGVYHLFTLKNRFNARQLPSVRIVDMRQELRGGNGSEVSGVLLHELRENISRGEQSILFLNRRGAASLVACGECGYTYSCPHCSVNLTWHSVTRRLVCHHCGYTRALDDACPECGGLLNQFGTGTQKLEEHLREALPDVEILRMDADSVSPAGSHEKILSQFREKKVPILIGTQMVTKGLDFENVTLVGVISADQLLYCGDYRAGERCFSLITQVVGRSGRGAKPGRAIIQTFTPQNPVIGMASRQDYEGFYAEEIELRRLQNCPPFSDIVTVTVSAEDESSVLRCCTYIRDRIRSELRGRKDAAVLGPAPLPVVRVSNRYRYRVTLHCRFDKEIRTLVSGLLIQCNTAKEYKGVSVFADYNPME